MIQLCTIETTAEEAAIKPSERFVYYDVCPLCSGHFKWCRSSLTMGHEYFLRFCTADPAKKDRLSSHLSKSHYFEMFTRFNEDEYIRKPYLPRRIKDFEQEIIIRKKETDPYKFLLRISFEADKSSKGDLINKRTEVQIKRKYETIRVPGWWNPGNLNCDYETIFARAKKLLHFA